MSLEELDHWAKRSTYARPLTLSFQPTKDPGLDNKNKTAELLTNGLFGSLKKEGE